MLDWLNERISQLAALSDRVLPSIRERLAGGHVTLPDDLAIHDNGLVYFPGRDELQALWFYVTEREGGQTYTYYRAVRLRVLTQIPIDARGDIGLLAKMRDALKGVYGARVDAVYLIAGVYEPTPRGIVQLYGAIGRGDTLEEAIGHAERGVGVLEATLSAAYPQIRFRNPDGYLATWLSTALTRMSYGLVAVGHPDPRENARGGDPALSPGGTLEQEGMQQYSLQQNELIMRGMAQLQEDFLIQVLLSPVERRAATQLLTGLAEYTSTWAAWQTGVRSFNIGTALPLLLSGALTHGAGTGYTASKAHTTTDGQTHTVGQADTVGHAQSHTEGHTVTDGHTVTVGHSHTEGQMTSDGQTSSHVVSDGTSSAQTSTHGSTSSTSSSNQVGINEVVSLGHSWGHTTGSSQSQSQTSGQSHTESWGQTTSHQETHMSSDTRSTSVSRSHTESQTTLDTTTNSQAHTTSSSDATSHTTGDSRGEATARGLSRGFSSGMAIGLSPSVSIGESNQWQFDPAIILTNVLRQQQAILNRVTLEGGFYADVYALARTERGQQALMALIPEAFQGREDVVTGVQTRALATPEEYTYLLRHIKAMTPSTREVRIPELVTAYADSTLLTVEQAAAYMAPGMFEEGAALTVQEKIPDFAFRPDMQGDAILGLQYSTERGELTRVPLLLTSERHFHTAFVGDTGFGKSVAAERLAYESTLHWHYRTIILDFGQGWRKALNWPAPELKQRVDIYQLYAGAVRPIRWNPLQVPKRIHPSRYRTLVAELYANAGRMGPRQLGFMRETLGRVYRKHGVLVDDQSPHRWKIVSDEDEEEAINTARRERGLPERRTKGYSLLTDDLEPFERQALLVYRSRRADLAEWVGLLREEMEKKQKARDYASISSLQGALLRLEQLVDYELRRMYGPGDDTIAIEDLGLNGPPEDPWGVTVIEGGAELDEFTKAALLAQLASILYLDAVVRRRESLGGRRFPPLQIFFEEANKVLTGVDVGGATSDAPGQGNQTTQIFLDMWRDGRKYRVFLHLIAQTVSELPAGILSSCNNGFFGQTKNDRDRAALLAHLARNTKGFVNTQYDRFLARMPVAMAIAKLGYSMDIGDIEPFLIRPLQVTAKEPSDEEIAQRFRWRTIYGR